MIGSIFVLILFTFVFFYVIGLNVEFTRTNKSNDKNFDGNGQTQYKGRGEENENVDVLFHGDVSVNSSIVFKGDCVLSGHGGAFLLQDNSEIIVDSGATLELRGLDLVVRKLIM